MTDPVFVEKAREVANQIGVIVDLETEEVTAIATALQEAAETARNDALEDAAGVAGKFAQTKPESGPGAAIIATVMSCTGQSIEQAIRALKSKAGE